MEFEKYNEAKILQTKLDKLRKASQKVNNLYDNKSLVEFFNNEYDRDREIDPLTDDVINLLSAKVIEYMSKFIKEEKDHYQKQFEEL